jgi:hypothetical protein
MSDTPTAVRIGVLGAARIAPNAILAPARNNAEAEIVAVAARDSLRAKEFAAKHDIAGVFGSYRELLADPGIDATACTGNGRWPRWRPGSTCSSRNRSRRMRRKRGRWPVRRRNPDSW